MIPYFDITFPALGPIQIHPFGVLVAIGILVGSKLTRMRGAQLGLQDEKIQSMITTVLLSGFFISHIFAVVVYQTKGPNPTLWELLNPFGGLSSFGGFLGALGALYVWCWRNRTRVMPYADSLAFGLSTGWIFGRLGCFTAHDHPGPRTDFFLAVQYPGGARHDLGLYEALWAIAISSVFWVLYRKNSQLGLYTALLALAYAPFRFALDFLRATDTPVADPRYFGLTPGHYSAICVFIAGIAVAIWTIRQPLKTTSPPSAGSKPKRRKPEKPVANQEQTS